jgi:hypothetical protein
VDEVIGWHRGQGHARDRLLLAVLQDRGALELALAVGCDHDRCLRLADRGDGSRIQVVAVDVGHQHQVGLRQAGVVRHPREGIHVDRLASVG